MTGRVADREDVERRRRCLAAVASPPDVDISRIK